MERQIPIYFDSIVVSSPFQGISETDPRIGRLKVRVFTKYANRNGSYITEEVANQLIESATKGSTPVVGFFDPETKTWASHTGPTLANAYGYVENFLGWEPFTDTDGQERDYAVFSVILFTDYFEEAQQILGQNQSMELDPASIQGEWALIEDSEYFVYTAAKILGFCIIGSHEPCFSVSSFFSKNDEQYKTQYEKFSSLLSDLKAQVEESENNKKGGEDQMNEFENQEVEQLENETPVVEDSQVQEVVEEVPEVFEEQEAAAEEEAPAAEEPAPAAEEENVPSEFEVLQQQFNELQEQYNQLQNDYSAAQASIENFTAQIENLQSSNTELQNRISEYEAQAAAIETERKNNLVDKYEKIISDTEEINVVRKSLNDFSYDELESKLAILYANQQMAGIGETEKVPLPDPAESQFALLMKKYRKN